MLVSANSASRPPDQNKVERRRRSQQTLEVTNNNAGSPTMISPKAKPYARKKYAAERMSRVCQWPLTGCTRGSRKQPTFGPRVTGAERVKDAQELHAALVGWHFPGIKIALPRSIGGNGEAGQLRILLYHSYSIPTDAENVEGLPPHRDSPCIPTIMTSMEQRPTTGDGPTTWTWWTEAHEKYRAQDGTDVTMA